MSGFIDTRIEGGVATLTMNSPEDRNALSRPDQCDALADALVAADARSEVKVVILTGAGPAFCAGGNIKDMKAKRGFMAGTPIELEAGYRRALHRIPLAFQAIDVPVIAAVNGPAMGAGLDITCMCDLRIASSRARFSEVFVRLGIISGIGGAWFLPRIIGSARAAELAFTAKVIGAEEALDWGLVSEVTEPEALASRSLELAREIAQHSRVALRFYKRLLRMADQQDLRGNLDATAPLQALAHLTSEHAEAVDRVIAALDRNTAEGRGG
ncbi:MAG: enoyl-CoA hydratase/isomerase family protein [Rhodospirillum sp.]|nr:enoyl-CoA hydratase/isomerase family protein [Rhodospirillum sp.]MCF8490960.1 enoyl-CoA hydratase/isomerase family protein [Rhodospirillum sp.]MCF8501478.1 enoyl-CoA hydratase/isomerase family protein [Rhodospirillum sp.]